MIEIKPYIKPNRRVSGKNLAALIYLWAVCIANQGFAKAEFSVDETTAYYDLTTVSEYLEDPTNQLTLEEVRSAAAQTNWRISGETGLSFGYTKSSYWIRVFINNESESIQQRFIEIAYPVLDYIEVYEFRNDLQVNNYQFGDQLPFNDRPINHSNFLVALDLPPSSHTEVLIRVTSGSAMQIPLSLWEQSALVERDQDLIISRGIYFGAMTIMALYNLMLFFVLRDKNFLYYVVYVMSMASFVFSLKGLSFKYFWPSATSWNDQSLVVFLALVVVAAASFTSSFLRVKDTRPLINKLLIFHAGLGVLCALLAFVLPYRLAILSTIISALSGILMCFTAGILRWQDGYHAVKYYLIAWTFMLGGGVVLALNKFGVVPNNLWTQNAVQIGSGLEVVLLSIALANQINSERRLREEAQKESIQAQANAVASLKQYQNLYNNAVQGLFLLDLRGYFTRINPSVSRMLSCDEQELLIKNNPSPLPIYHFFPDLNTLITKPDKLIRGESIRLKGKCQNGKTIWTVITLRPVFENQKLEFYEGSMVDISESIEKEEALRERETAESTAKAKSAFLATMSHEIRTPMNGVLGMVEMLRGTDLNFHQTRYVNTIYNSGRALLGVINDILDYSKIESNKLEVEKISVDLSELIDECVSVFSNLCEEKNLPLYVDLDPKIPSRISSDSTRIRQIILNLLSNAFKFTENGYVYIRVDQMADSMIRFTVQDTGIGLDNATQSKLFTSFSQADSSTTRKYGGTGLGLAISKRLAELMGGEIGVVSESGNGSKFWFTIKNYQEEAAPPVSVIKNSAKQLLMIATEDKKFSKAYHRYLRSQVGKVVALNDVDQLIAHLERSTTLKDQLFLLQDSFFDAISAHQQFRKIKDRIVVLTQAGKARKYQDKIKHQLILERPVSPFQITQTIKYCLEPDSPIQELLDEVLDIRGLRFLVAEDNTVNQMVIKGILKKHGGDVTIAENGQTAVEKFRNHQQNIDVVLMDIEMPVMNGYEATQAIRNFEKQQGLQRTAIFGLSAHALAEYMTQATAAGMDGFITKPITLKQLITALHPITTERKAS
ncbi:MAG: ATP-binding protein [Pseudomonadales bacterium]|nr:ATP-binding protein [Pseudomonadales bacterium]